MQQDGQPSVALSLLCLRALQNIDDPTDEDLQEIYLYTQQYCLWEDIKATNFVDEGQFITNVRQQRSEFLEVFRKAMEANEYDGQF